jgi:hypothetical protein
VRVIRSAGIVRTIMGNGLQACNLMMLFHRFEMRLIFMLRNDCGEVGMRAKLHCRFSKWTGRTGSRVLPESSEVPVRLGRMALPLFCLALSSCAQLPEIGHSGAAMLQQALHLSPSASRVDSAEPHRASLTAGAPAFGTRQYVESVSRARASLEIKRSVRGAVLYLDDTQIRDRPGTHSSLYDYCRWQVKSCDGVLLINAPGGADYIQIKGLPIGNSVGEWANIIHALPGRFGDFEGEVLIAVQDSNVFTTAGILYPLYFIDERLLPENARLAERMRSLAAASLVEYKRGEAYSFWMEMIGETSAEPRTGPPNLPVGLIQAFAVILHYPLYPAWKVATVGLNVGIETWIWRVLSRAQNPYGFDSIFNIPNDADDTAIVVALQKLHSVLQPQDRIRPDISALKMLVRYRDIGRAKQDKRNQRHGIADTGAFLTWLKDENLGTFSRPEQGIIPLGANNVDCVVNANALFSLALNDADHWDGFEDSKALLAASVKARTWTDVCALYYPQLMMLPYALTRAYREGEMGADPEMRATMGLLLRDLLEMQHRNGSFPGGKDRTRHLSTALAVNALLNMGAEIAHEHDRFDQFQSAIEKAIGFLVSERRLHRLMFGEDSTSGHGRSSGKGPGYKWASGLFFAGSYGDLAQWRSEAYSTAIVLEALAKYMLAYDLTGSTLLDGERLQVTSYDTRAAASSFKPGSDSRSR